ncbi:MAG: hypothetical protein SVO01_00780 [Thermotogota bacterium]|nr:hypothetical protein [Thermotogota bacterium]
MNKFIQHIPNFIEVDKPRWIEFETIEDLLNIPVVKQWKKPINGKSFSYFAISDNVLIVVHDNGFHWWAVGYIEKPELIKLPKWTGGKYKAQFLNGDIKIVSSKNVISSCGNILTLKDGTKAKDVNY